MTESTKNEQEQQLPIQPPEQSLAPNQQAEITPLGQGHEDIDEEDEVTIPRAVVVQFTSEIAKKPQTDPQRRDAGLVVNSITQEILPMEFIPIIKTVNFIRWNGRKVTDANYDPAYKPGQMIFSTRNRRDARVVDGKNFGPNGELPLITKYIEFLCLFKGSQYPVLLSFSKTSARAGADFNTLTKIKGGNRWDHTYRLQTTLENNDSGSFFKLSASYVGLTDPSDKKNAEYWYKIYKDRQQIKVHETGEEQEKGEAAWGE